MTRNGLQLREPESRLEESHVPGHWSYIGDRLDRYLFQIVRISIPNFRNDKLFFLQIVNNGYRLLIKFNPLTSNTHISTDVFEMLVKPFEESFYTLILHICVIYVFIKAGTPLGMTFLKCLDGSSRISNSFVNRLLNLVYLVILFTTFLLQFIQTVVADPSIRWTDVWFRFQVLFTTTCLEAPRVMKKLRPSTKLDCAAGLIFWIYLFLDPFTGRTLRIVWIVWSSRDKEIGSRAAMLVEKPAEQ